MKAEDSFLFHLLGGGQRQFVIPVFQRDYSWSETQCRQFFNDVIRVGAQDEGATHFIGSIVSVASTDQGAVLPQWLVIDGQQRLTTCTILLTVLRNRLTKRQDLPITDTAEALEEQYLTNKFAPPLLRARLSLRGADDVCLKALLSGGQMPAETSSKVTANAMFFDECLTDVDELIVLRGMRRLLVVAVTLSPKYDNPQLIFESLNSTGMALTQADLVRNYVLMGHAEQRQTEWYEEYWRPLEVAFGMNYRASFDTFLRDFLALELKSSNPPRLDHVYREFRIWYPSRLDTREAEVDAKAKLNRLRRFGSHYCTFMFDQQKASGAVCEVLLRLKTLVDVAAPAVMVWLELWLHDESIGEKETAAGLELLESYVLRRSMVSADTRSGGKIFNVLAQRMTGPRPLARLAALLARMPKAAEFPTDSAFKNALQTQDLYGRRSLKYMLDRMTNSGKEKVVTDNLTIEHVLPQKEELAPEWQEMLGVNWREIRELNQHKLGNLTLTGFNSELQARPFQSKKEAPGWGYAHSAVWLSRRIAREASWGEAQIAERGKELAELAASLWVPVVADQDMLLQLDREEAIARSAGHSLEALKWSAGTAHWFESLRNALLSLGEEVIELPRGRSVVYHSSQWFIEVLPRARGFTVRLAAEPEDLTDIAVNVQDASAWLFVLNSTVNGGSLFTVNSQAECDLAIQLARRTYETVRL